MSLPFHISSDTNTSCAKSYLNPTPDDPNCIEIQARFNLVGDLFWLEHEKKISLVSFKLLFDFLLA
jgi:hypothetical protein